MGFDSNINIVQELQEHLLQRTPTNSIHGLVLGKEIVCFQTIYKITRVSIFRDLCEFTRDVQYGVYGKARNDFAAKIPLNPPKEVVPPDRGV